MAFSLFGTTRKAATTAPKRSGGQLPLARLHELQCRACPLDKAVLKKPKMQATGSAKPLLYLLGEAPGKTEDETPDEHVPKFGGHLIRQFLGKAGQRLRAEIPSGLRSLLRFNNTLQCRPPGNRTPAPQESECCRRRIEADIIASKPKAVLALGGTAAAWFGAEGGINLWRGMRFPYQLGGHRFWVYPVFHPSFVIRTEGQQRGEGNQMDKERSKLWSPDLQRCFRDLETLPEPEPLAEEDFLKEVRFFTGDEGLVDLEYALSRLDLSLVAVDVETKELRPYAAGAKLLTLAFSDGTRTVGIALEHPGAKWLPAELVKVWKLIVSFFKRVKRIVAHRFFDAEWLVDRFFPYDGEACLFQHWEDTSAQAYVLNGDKGALSLNTRSLLFFGLPIKELSDVDRKKLHTFPVGTVLRYNCLDAEVTARLFHPQRAELERRGQWAVYRFHMQRLPALVLAQRRGVLVDQAQARAFQKDFAAQIKALEIKLNEDADVVSFRRVNGPVNFRSVPQLVKLFRDHLKRPEGVRGLSYSTDDAVLSAMAENDVKVAKILVEHRALTKLKGTYIDSLILGSPGADVYPDGRLHTTYNDTGTDTSRLASDGPNCFTARMEALTRRGWIHFGSLQADDLLAQYDPASGLIDFAAPLSFVSLGAQPVLRVFTDKQIDLEMTLDHRCLLRRRKRGRSWSFFRAESYPQDYLQYQAGVYVGGSEKLRSSQVVVACAFQADAHFNGRIDWGFSKQRKVRRLIHALLREGISFRWKKDLLRGRDRIIVSKQDVPSWLASKKFFGPWILDLDRTTLDFLSEEVWFWDGTHQRRSMFASVVRSNADWVQILTCLSNRRARLRPYDNDLPNAQVCWTVDASNRNFSMTTNTQIERLSDQPVFCVSMPRGTVIVRGGANVHITGQCQNFPSREHKELRNQVVAG